MTSESPETNQEYYSLISISSDGKILTWKNPTKSLRYPIKGHIFTPLGADIERRSNNQVRLLGGYSVDIIQGQKLDYV